MPRSVNSVASRARRKKLSNKPKVILVEEKMFGPLPKTQLKRLCFMPTVTEELKNGTLGHCGLQESMLEPENTVCLTASLWERLSRIK